MQNFLVHYTNLQLVIIYMSTHINILLKNRNEKNKNKSDEQYILSKLKSVVTFTHSHNKCYTIFTKHLFSIVIGHNLILLWNLLCLYSNIYANSYKYLKEKKIQKEDWKRKKKIYSTVATVTIGQIKRHVAITTCLRAWKKLWLYFLFFFSFFPRWLIVLC